MIKKLIIALNNSLNNFRLLFGIFLHVENQFWVIPEILGLDEYIITYNLIPHLIFYILFAIIIAIRITICNCYLTFYYFLATPFICFIVTTTL